MLLLPIARLAEGVSTMASLSDAGEWMKQHPYATGAIVFGGGLALLWLFGYIGGGSSSQTSSSGGNTTAAYYAAEAAQSQAGAAIQLGTLQTQAATAQAKIQADAATAINESNNQATMTVNQQNTGSANTIAGLELQGTMHNADTAYLTAVSNNASATAINDSNNSASIWQTIYGTLFPAEIAQTGGWGVVNAPSGQAVYIGAGSGLSYAIGQGPAALAARGYTPAQFAALSGLPQA
jgi:hypothetical protein